MENYVVSSSGHLIPRETSHGVRSERLLALFVKFGVSGVARRLGLARYSVVRWRDIPEAHRETVQGWKP